MRGSTMKTMGQGAHHLGTSLAPALPNPLLRRGIGASSLPAPPPVTTRAGPGRLAHGSTPIPAAAQGCSTRSAGAGARHMGHGSVRTDERHLQSRCRGLLRHGAMPVAIAPRPDDVAATHNLPQRTTRLNLRPGRARRLSEAGRHWAPIARQRATREARHSGRTGPAYCNKPKWAPPVMDGMGRTVAPGDGRCTPEDEYLHLRFFRRRSAIGGACAPASMSLAGHYVEHSIAVMTSRSRRRPNFNL